MIWIQARVKKRDNSFAIILLKAKLKAAGYDFWGQITLWIIEKSDLMNSKGILKKMENKYSKKIIKKVKKGWK
ncbi:hypothetical protein J4455_01165 [Candidatus Woesearchaeota archaeon]|nr:hypothetical protein [Candidatus Woesearchaeota archaeon]